MIQPIIIGLYKNTIEEQVTKLKTAKSEAIKEFAERLKESCYTHSDICGYQSTVIDAASVDNLVEEMAGE